MSVLKQKAGITYIGIETTSLIVTAKTIAEHMNTAEAKVKEGLMVNQFRFPGYSDNFVTMAANNLYRFIENAYNTEELRAAIERYGIDAIYLATETSREGSKAGSALVLEIVEPVLYKEMKESNNPDKKKFLSYVLSILPYADILETKLACTAEAKTVNFVVNEIENGSINSAVVMAPDIAIYYDPKAKNAEITQGAASTFLYMTKNPLIMRLDHKSAHYNMPSDDFYKSNEHTPHVPSGVGSEINYVFDISSAVERYEQKFGLPKKFYIVSHVPFPKEAVYLASFLFMHMYRRMGLVEEIESKLGMKEPLYGEKSSRALLAKVVSEYADSDADEGIAKWLASNEKVKELWSFHKKLREKKLKEFEDFKESIGLSYSLKLPSEVGNSYNSSMWVALASLLLNAKEKKPVMLASYGSGSGTTVRLGKMLLDPGSEQIKRLIDIQPLMRGRELSVEEYRELHSNMIAKEEHDTNGKDRVQMDKELLGDKYDESLFKLVRYDKNRKGVYQFNGEIVKSGPVVL